MTWWRNDRFGMFIHWGLYAMLGGEWNGSQASGFAEWIMCRNQIPVREYEKLAAKFNPTAFSADGMAGLAREAGMKYLVITAKHHEGFALFKSKASPYNVVDATPFGRDIIGELAEACAKKEIRFGVYYSQALDWHHPDAAGNDWDFPDEDKKNFQRFLDDKVYPQVDELLSNYGEICELWFDTPTKITPEQSADLLRFVREKQPNCIVNSRLGPGGDKEWGDYTSLRDNEVPTLPLEEDAETCSTINQNWGYNKHDLNYRPARDIVRLLADVVAKNANYLLNIGPDGEGRVPGGSVEVLRDIGRWMQTHGESIYGAMPTPFPVDFDWSAVTHRPGRMYFHMFTHPVGRLVIRGLKTPVKGAFFLNVPDEPISVIRRPAAAHSGLIDTVIELAGVPRREIHRVLALELDGNADAHKGIVQQPDGVVMLESLLARNADTGKSMTGEIMARGAVARSLQDGHKLEWDFEVLDPGLFDVLVESAAGRYTDHRGKKAIDTGHAIQVAVDKEQFDGIVEEHERFGIRGNSHWEAIRGKVGSVRIDQPGAHTLRMTVNKVVLDAKCGFILRQLRLVPAADPS